MNAVVDIRQMDPVSKNLRLLIVPSLQVGLPERDSYSYIYNLCEPSTYIESFSQSAIVLQKIRPLLKNRFNQPQSAS